MKEVKEIREKRESLKVSRLLTKDSSLTIIFSFFHKRVWKSSSLSMRFSRRRGVTAFTEPKILSCLTFLSFVHKPSPSLFQSFSRTIKSFLTKSSSYLPLAICLRDLIYIEDGNPLFYQNQKGVINVERLTMLSKAVYTVLPTHPELYNSSFAHLEPDNLLLDVINKVSNRCSSLYSLSLSLVSLLSLSLSLSLGPLLHSSADSHSLWTISVKASLPR